MTVEELRDNLLKAEYNSDDWRHAAKALMDDGRVPLCKIEELMDWAQNRISS